MTPADQRTAALAIANERRARAAAVRRRVHDRELSVTDVLEHDDLLDQARTLRVATLLRAAPYVGPDRAQRILRRARVDGDLRLGDLEHRPHARARLADAYVALQPPSSRSAA
ncbi:hypothetical protein SK069_05885 [Patulibacter brassicae]|uniref:Integration host factor n=1 Tax=Patulibacter brassicae TaxID=1705717 RepID=A0ABU4VJY4_9ACTN|nr:hypothetical protein [Patulibacter brassicae]MDX8151115.1 hypothetical protein [Patulibacter brassicae]